MAHRALVRLPKTPLAVDPPWNDGAVGLWGPAESAGSAVTQDLPFDDDDLSGNNYTLSAPPLAGGGTASIPPTVIARWRGEIESLSIEQRQSFLEGLPEGGLQKYADAVGDLISEQVQKSQSLRVGRWIAPLVQLVEMSRPFADALNSIYPPAGMILGGVTFVLSTSQRYVQYQEAVVAFLVKICKNLNIIDRYKERFPTEEMQLALIDVYGDIIQFCARASRPFLDSKGKTRIAAVSFFKSQIKSFKAEFGDIEENLATHLEVFDRTAILALGQMSSHLQKTQLMSLKMQARSNEVDKLHRTEEEERRIKTFAKERDELRRQMLDWISITDFRTMQEEKLESTLPGTAQWLLDHNSFKSWKLQSRPRLLYLHGKAGSGKSHLAARLIRDIDLWCREQNANLAKLESQPSRERHEPNKNHAKLESHAAHEQNAKLDSHAAHEQNANHVKLLEGQPAREQNATQARLESHPSREPDFTLANMETQRKYAMAYVYCGASMAESSSHKNPDRTSEGRSGGASILSSILRQLYSCLPKDQDVDFLTTLYDENQSSKASMEDIRECIRLIVAKFARTFIVVDGLDECSGFKDIEFENLCTFISSLASLDAVSSPASVAVFSRPGYPAIEDTLGEASRIQVDVGANQADIDIFIAERTRNLTSNTSTLQDIKATLSGDADGMFLWVSLVIDSIKKERSDKKRRLAAKNMPKGLAGAYSVALERVMAQEDSVKDVALRTLLWIANSERPLTKPELLEALSIEQGMSDLEPEDRIDDMWLVKDCADLVLVKNEQYTLLHVSLKEYLTHPPQIPSGPFAEYWVLQSNSHATLAEMCLTYLMLDSFKHRSIEADEDAKSLVEKYPLLNYAAEYWGTHVAKVASTGKDGIMSIAKEFLDEQHLLHLWGQLMSAEKDSADSADPQPLHLVSYFGLTELTSHFDAAELQLKSRDQNGQTPLELAFERRHIGIAEWLMSQNALTATIHEANGHSLSDLSLIWLAARNNWKDIVTKLLNMGFDGNESEWFPRQGWLTPLQVAVQCGSDEAAQALIDARVDVNIQTHRGETALMMAIAMQRLSIMDKLLGFGADVTVRGKDGNTALTNAIRHSLLGAVTDILAQNTQLEEMLDTRGTLQIAAAFGAHNVVDVLLEYGAALECMNQGGLTPLAVAATRGHLDVVKKLLSRGAILTSQSTDKGTIFHHVLQAPLPKRVDTLQWILEHGDEYAKLDPRHPLDPVEVDSGFPAAAVTIKLALLLTPDTSGEIPLQKAASLGDVQSTKLLLETLVGNQMIARYGYDCLGRALRKGDFDCSELLFHTCKAVLPQFPPPDEFLMAFAAWSGNADLIPLVLGNGGSPMVEDDFHKTALENAAYWGYVDFIRSLEQQVPELSYLHKDNVGRTSLHRAIYGGELEALKALLPHYSIDDDLGDIHGGWPLHVAASEGRLDCVEALINFDPNGVDRPNNSGETALSLAAIRGHDSIVDYLLEHAGANVNAKDNEGFTTLHRSIANYRTDMAHLVIGKGKLLATAATDGNGWTALHHAAYTGNKAVALRLLDCGNEPYPEDQDGRTPFFLAVENLHHEIVDLYLSRGLDGVVKLHGPTSSCALAAATSGSLDLWRQFIAIDKTLAEDRDDEGDDSICNAAFFGHVHMLEDMLAIGLDVDGKTEHGGTALIMATQGGNVDAVRYLCQRGANLNSRGMHGLTALHWAVIEEYPACERALIEAGADQQIRDDLGLLPRGYKPYVPLDPCLSSPEADILDPRDIHWPSTRQFVLQSVVRLRSTNLPPPEGGFATALWKRERRAELNSLSKALCFLGDLQAVALVKASSKHISTWSCALCSYNIQVGQSWYWCTHCFKDVCKHCRPVDFGRLTAIWLVERMESDTVAIIKVLGAVARKGHHMLLEVLNTHRALWDWVDKREQAYRTWNFKKGVWYCNQRETPGWELASILGQLGREFGRMGRPAVALPSFIDVRLQLRNRLRRLLRDFSQNRVISLLNCEGHRYLEIPPLTRLPEDMKAMIGPENEFTDLFFRTLEDRYKPNERADSLIISTETTSLYTGHDAGLSEDINQPPSEADPDEADGTDMHVVADRQIEVLISPIQHDLMRQWRLITPGKQGKTREEQELVLETAWQLAQAIAYHEVRMPSLANLNESRPIRSYWRKGSEREVPDSDTDNDSSSLSDLDSNWSSDL